MEQPRTWRQRRIAFMHRFAARRSARAKVTTQFVRMPEPRTLGVVSRGKQLIAGQFLFSGLMVQSPKTSIWKLAADNPGIAEELHGFVWLDDLAAVSDNDARAIAQDWVFEWITTFGNGRTAGWTPGLTGKRLIRLINHGPFLLKGRDPAQVAMFYRSLAQQTLFLSRRWSFAQEGLRSFEALCGLVYAAAALEGYEAQRDVAMEGLLAACDRQFAKDGSIANRNPEELLEYLCLLILVKQALEDIGRSLPEKLASYVAAIVPILRNLRHMDGGLARFHGGGRGVEGRLDQALAFAGVRSVPAMRLYMGYARLSGGRTSVIVDAASPPAGAASCEAHASTLGFELTSGRRPIIVNAGSGARFGADWRRASRATPSHSTLGIDGTSSSHLARQDEFGSEELTRIPNLVRANLVDLQPGRRLESSHDGYRPSFGLTHARILELSVDGRGLNGEDLLATLQNGDERLFDTANTRGRGVPFAIRFHLHPEVTPYFDEDRAIVSLTLKSGEVWTLSAEGGVKMALMPSVYLQDGLLRPRSSQQVVLSGRAMSYATRVRWELAKAQETPTLVRDFAQADLAV